MKALHGTTDKDANVSNSSKHGLSLRISTLRN